MPAARCTLAFGSLVKCIITLSPGIVNFIKGNCPKAAFTGTECVLLFVQEFDQKNFHAGTFRDKKFYKLIQSVGMPALTNGKKHTPHDCRHTFSWLCDTFGVDDMSKHMIMGHSLGRDVEKAMYGHRTFEQLKEEINKIQIDLSLICH